jgi:hypothetical protein
MMKSPNLEVVPSALVPPIDMPPDHPIPIPGIIWSPPPLSTFMTMKDKASDLGLKDVMDKDSWIEAKKIIGAHLCRPPYCPGPNSKLLITTNVNAITSAWWEC